MLPENHLPFECSFCILNFASRSELSSHVMHHFKQKPCLSCDQTVFQIGDDWYEIRLHKHEEYNHTEVSSIYIKPEYCVVKEEELDTDLLEIDEQICDKEYLKEENLRLDKAIIDTDNNDIAEDEMDMDSEIAATDFEPKPIDEEEKSEKNSKAMYDNPDYKPKHQCKICNEAFIKRKDFQNHRDQVHDGNILACKICSKEFKIRWSLVKHEATHSDRRALACEICGKIYKNIDSIRRHMLIHTEKYKCDADACSKCFYSLYSLKNHIRIIHNGESPYKCDICEKSLSSLSVLKTHMTSHSSTRPFMCEICGKGFNSKFHLSDHRNTHTNHRPYACKFCEKRFPQWSQLIIHTRIHTQEKPYRCNVEGCDRAYRNQIDLKRHLYGQHRIYTKKHICPICSKVYPEKKYLTKHMESH